MLPLSVISIRFVGGEWGGGGRAQYDTVTECEKATHYLQNRPESQSENIAIPGHWSLT